MRFRTSMDNEGSAFYTDLNGFQLTRRRTYSKLPLQANFYPMPTMAMIQDQDKRFTVLSAQPLGVAALKKGTSAMIIVLHMHIYPVYMSFCSALKLNYL